MSLKGNVSCWALYPFQSTMHHFSPALKGTLKISNNNFKLGKLLRFFFNLSPMQLGLQELVIPSEQYGKYVDLVSRTVNCTPLCWYSLCRFLLKWTHVEFFFPCLMQTFLKVKAWVEAFSAHCCSASVQLHVFCSFRWARLIREVQPVEKGHVVLTAEPADEPVLNTSFSAPCCV